MFGFRVYGLRMFASQGELIQLKRTWIMKWILGVCRDSSFQKIGFVGGTGYL